MVGNATIDINGSHRVWGGGCVWDKYLPWCGSASCTALVPLRLELTADYKIIVRYGAAISNYDDIWCGYAYVWEKQFSAEELVDGKVDCLAISGLELSKTSCAGIGTGAKCHITAYPHAQEPVDWECECHEQALYAFGYLAGSYPVPGICPGPAAIEAIIDGQSFTLIRSWKRPCEDYSMETADGRMCNMGYAPAWAYDGPGDIIPDTVDYCNCTGMQRSKCKTGLSLEIYADVAAWHFGCAFTCWEDESHTYTNETIYYFQADSFPLVGILPIPCEGICGLDVEGEIFCNRRYCYGKGEPDWNSVPCSIRAIA